MQYGTKIIFWCMWRDKPNLLFSHFVFLIDYKKRSYPEQLQVEKGSVVHIICISHSGVMWYYEGEGNPENIFLTPPTPGGNIYTLSIFKANEDNHGGYVCRGQDKDELLSNYFLSKSEVMIKGKPHSLPQSHILC